jgi:hypothetical protein
MADQSCRTEGSVNADVNRHDSSKLSVRRTSTGNKSWIKFNIGDLDVANLMSATLTVSLHEGKGGDQQFDVSFVNDNVTENIGWDDRSITWNNAPGNKTDDLGLLDPAKTTYLGTITFTDGLPGQSFAIDALPALQEDTDGIVQFVLHNSPNLLQFSTHDHSVVEQRPFLDVTTRHNGANDPIPDDEASVETSLTQLEWTNPDPNDPLANITCDVYFGTEPNRLHMDMVAINPGEDSVQISRFPRFLTPENKLQNKTWHYWIVDCHDPSAGPDKPEKQHMPGLMWSFYTDDNQPPVVYLGADLVTWLGMSGTPDTETIDIIPVLFDDDGLPSDKQLTATWLQVDNGAPGATIVASGVYGENASVTVTAADIYEFEITANDGAKTASDTIQIFVGADPCDASHISTDAPYNSADANHDCIVDLADFADIIAANWLDCTDTLTSCAR